jgi:type IV pilus assembly protein PilV
MPTNKQIGLVAAPAQSCGTSMLEILITILILSVGMLGLAALQGKAHTSELESYQRGQALVLLQDINSRMEGNMSDAANYVTAGVGTGATDAADCTTLATRAAIDLCEWSKALKGSSETKGGSTIKQGAMIDGRGCVAATGTNVYLLSVVWQGLDATAAPATACGKNLYDSEATRRAVTMTFLVPDLSGS